MHRHLYAVESNKKRDKKGNVDSYNSLGISCALYSSYYLLLDALCQQTHRLTAIGNSSDSGKQVLKKALALSDEKLQGADAGADAASQ